MENEQTRSTASILSVFGRFVCVYMMLDHMVDERVWTRGVHGRWKYFAITIWKHIDVDEKVFKEVEFI